MKAQKKRSREKERFKHYRGYLIWTNSPYGYDMKDYRVGLFYSRLHGIDVYFKSISAAKQHVDMNYNLKVTDNDIPF